MRDDVLRSTFRNQKIVVLGGGFSRERDISLRSASGVFQALTSLGYDAELRDPASSHFGLSDRPFVFNMLHGRYGEDGVIQSYMDQLGVIYTGSSVRASLMAMNKIKTKWMLKNLDMPTPDFCVGVSRDVPDHDLSFPIVLKPIDEGSSVGVEVLDTKAELKSRVSHHYEVYGTYMLESFIEGSEITVSILESESEGRIELPILELRPKNRFYDYESKYTPGMTEFIIPAELPSMISNRCQSLGYQFFKAMGCVGFGRVDMIVSPTEGPLILEMNTVPGMTATSDLPAQAEQAGISYSQLVDTIFWGAYPRFVQSQM